MLGIRSMGNDTSEPYVKISRCSNTNQLNSGRCLLVSCARPGHISTEITVKPRGQLDDFWSPSRRRRRAAIGDHLRVHTPPTLHLDRTRVSLRHCRAPGLPYAANKLYEDRLSSVQLSHTIHIRANPPLQRAPSLLPSLAVSPR